MLTNRVVPAVAGLIAAMLWVAQKAFVVSAQHVSVVIVAACMCATALAHSMPQHLRKFKG